MKIQVTQNDIDNGATKDCECCAVALAIKRHYPKCEVTVSSDAVIITPPYKQLYLSLAARVFIMAFDKGYSVKPFNFELEYELRKETVK